MNPTEALCPNCRAKVPVQAVTCPVCSHSLTPPKSEGGPSPAKSTRGWPIFFGVLLLPALLTLVTARSDDVWPFFTFGLSLITALYCGFWLAGRICRTTGARLAAGVALSGGFYVLSFILCCAGCAIGGAQLDFR